MSYIADLHIHSRYAQATSPSLTPETLYQWAAVKGIQVLGTGDFTHPAWLAELKEKLEPCNNGLFRLKQPPVETAMPGMKVKLNDLRFCLSTEICTVYLYNGKMRKNHHLVYAPDFETVHRINHSLAKYGNLEADGRPTVQLSSRDLLEIVLQASPQAYLVPAHVWTPWFSTLGSKGGYDSVEDCFRDLSSYVFALETGLSSDPDMNRKWSRLDRFTLLSSSDAHSPSKLGREANLFHTGLSYEALFEAVKTGQGFAGTYEFFPEEGKYFLDGHRKCGIFLQPGETALHKGICPRCGRPLTVGVLNRVEKLTDRSAPLPGNRPAGFHYIIPLAEILAEIHGVSVGTKKQEKAYCDAITAFGNEFSLLTEVPVADIHRYNPVLAEAIRRMRLHQVIRTPGYDGVYGTIRLFNEGEQQPSGTQQLGLF